MGSRVRDVAVPTVERRGGGGALPGRYLVEWEGTFLWAWANETIPPAARAGLDRVRDFGEVNDLPLLTTPTVRGSRADALEILAIAGRLLDAEGVFISSDADVTCYFALTSFWVEPSPAAD